MTRTPNPRERRALLGLDLDDRYTLTLTGAEIADAERSLRLDAAEEERAANRARGTEAVRLCEGADRLRALAAKLWSVRTAGGGPPSAETA